DDAPSPFAVTASDPADGGRVGVTSSVTVRLNDTVLLATVEAADLKVDGVAAAGVTVVDGTTLMFRLAGPLAEGTHTITVAAGALRDIQQTPLAAYSSQFFVDLTPPRIIASSVQQGDNQPMGSFTLTVQFSEPLNASLLSWEDFSLISALDYEN